VLGEEHPSTLFTKTMFGAVLIDAGRLDESGAILAEAIGQYEAQGMHDFGWLRAKTILANVHRHAGRAGLALAAHLEIQQPCDSALGETHPICRSNLAGSAECLRSLGEESRARELEARVESLKAPRRP
jgi:hypothetical protein